MLLEKKWVVEIEAENTIKQSVFSTNPEMVSTKKDSHRHGFGLDTIRKIVEIYDGQYSFGKIREKIVFGLYKAFI